MEQKCSNSSHKENIAISFCQECKIYMCNKCDKLHSEFIENHHQFKLEKEKSVDEIFTGLCKQNIFAKFIMYYAAQNVSLKLKEKILDSIQTAKYV